MAQLNRRVKPRLAKRYLDSRSILSHFLFSFFLFKKRAKSGSFWNIFPLRRKIRHTDRAFLQKSRVLPENKEKNGQKEKVGG